jgi:hypothetical protein
MKGRVPFISFDYVWPGGGRPAPAKLHSISCWSAVIRGYQGMKLAVGRAGIIASVAILLQACLGGGGGDNGGSGPPPPDPLLSVSTTDIAIAAEPGEVAPTATVDLTVTNAPTGGVFVEADNSAFGIESIDFPSMLAGLGTLKITFKLPALLTNNTYSDIVNLRVCADALCASEVEGSPVTIQVAYTVSGGIEGTLASSAVDSTTDRFATAGPVESLRLNLSKPTGGPLHAEILNSTHGLSFIDFANDAPDHLDFEFQFAAGSGLDYGTYSDSVTLTVCYEPTCARQIIGSPFRLTTNLTVNPPGEQGLTSLQLQSCPPLRYSVLDAEYSKALDAIVMIGDIDIAIIVYDPHTCTEKLQFLDDPAWSVSVSPDGLTAALAQTGHISIVDLTQVGSDTAPDPVDLDASTNVLDVLLTSDAKVYFTSQGQQPREPKAIHTVDIATNTEQLGGAQLANPNARLKLHPSGQFLYSNRAGSPDDLVKWDITSGTASWVRESPYEGEYGPSYYLWMSEPGDMLYTVSGYAFHASTDPAQDLVFAGSLQLPPPLASDWVVRSLSQNEATKEIASIESEYLSCEYTGTGFPCFTHVVLYNSDTLERKTTYSLPPGIIDGIGYPHFGHYIFHNAAGTQKYLISAAVRADNEMPSFRVSVIQ